MKCITLLCHLTVYEMYYFNCHIVYAHHDYQRIFARYRKANYTSIMILNDHFMLGVGS